ncbi:MAG: prephenate dehydratase [Candidatus Omnitrophota bacterium]|nr:MAG: prephenate dehydratase [Candidatus Omnitrophota bacterium]
MKLKELRENIDRIDKGILQLLNRRAKEVIKISKLKKNLNYEVFAPEREIAILKCLAKINKGPLSGDDVEMVFKEVLSVCRSLRIVLKIAYLGPQGTFTHLAAVKKFGKKPQYIPAESIGEVFDRVEKGEVDYGVVPIENSIEGVVNYTLDMFFSSPLKICSEITLSISHALLGTSSGRIKKIYSNPQVFAQCRRWISRNVPDIELIPTSSTAKAARLAKRDSRSGCIGSKILANLYGLKVITSSIEDSPQNYTRFLVISKTDSFPSGKDKTSILFSIKDRVGALHDVLSGFKKFGTNLTKIESRPSKKKPWEYYFFVDFEGHRESASVKDALRELEKGCIFVKILGSYPKES